MIVSSKELVTEWSNVLRTRPEAQGPVLLFVALPDCDAVAAAMALTALLREEMVRFEVIPVSDYKQFAEEFRHMSESANPRSLICINCGGRADLEKLLDLENVSDKDLPIFVLDSMRPFHLNNVESDRIHLLDDSTESVDTSTLPLSGFEDVYGFVEIELDDDSEEEDEEGFIVDDDVVFEGGSESDEAGNSEEENDGSKRRRKGKSGPGKKVVSKRARQSAGAGSEMKQQAYEYYSSSHWATCSSLIAYLLAIDLNKEDPASLWLAMVGLSDHYVFGKATKEAYEQNALVLKAQLDRFYGEDQHQQRKKKGNTASLGATLDSGELIQFSQEPRLELLRHWSLYDAILHSTYMSSRLRTWRQTGRRKVLEFLATLGIPIRASQQGWHHMSSERRGLLETSELDSALDRLDLEDFHYDSFVKSKGGYKMSVTALDLVLAVSGTLELGSSSGARDILKKGNPSEELFWNAYDVLGDKLGSRALQQGLELAASAQKLLIMVAGQIIDQRTYVSSGHFRYTFLRDGQCIDTVRYPLILTRLAKLLMDTIEYKGEKSKPMLVLAPLPSKATWLAVGVTRPTNYNDFGARFRMAAAKNGSTISEHGFFAHAVEIQDGQETEFIRFLHDVMR